MKIDRAMLCSQTWRQVIHSCANKDDIAEIKIEAMDAGGGHYLVLHAHEFALDTADEIDELCRVLKESLAMAKEHDDE